MQIEIPTAVPTAIILAHTSVLYCTVELTFDLVVHGRQGHRTGFKDFPDRPPMSEA